MAEVSVITVYVKRGVILCRYDGVVLATVHTVVDEWLPIDGGGVGS